MKKVISIILVLAMILSLAGIAYADSSGTWKKDSRGWWYQNADGTYPANEWKKIDGKWYHFDAKGYMQTGWLKDAGKWYYLNSGGIMQTGWQKIDGKWYYFKAGGDMVNGWQKIDGKWYYFKAGGDMVTGWQKIDSKWYYFKAGGEMATGWQKISNNWYYFNSGGIMQTGWQDIGSKTYYLKPSGIMAAGEWCKGYYLNANGTWTYKYKASWKKDSKGWRYEDTSGWYAKSATVKIDDKEYKFDSRGYWIEKEGDQVLRVAFRGDPNGLCHVTTTVASANTPAYELMMDRLFDYDSKTGKVIPMLATGWEPLSDTTYRVTLRSDVYSWNGDKFKASDVLYTIKAAQDSGKHARYYGNFDVDKFVIEDDTHIVIALKKMDPFIQTTLSNIPYGMMVEASVKAGGGLEKMDGQKSNMPNCYTGPYIPVEWSSGSYIRFVRNENYWGDEPFFSEIVIYSVADASARTEVLEAGDVDLALEPNQEQTKLIEANDDLAVLSYPTTNHHTLFTNTQLAPFDDVNVRIACALALNYDANIQMALGGYGKHSDDILPIGSPMYASPASEGYESFYTYNLSKAKEYMAKSKYAGQDIVVEIYYTPQHEAYVPLIQQQWAEIGITVQPTPIAMAAFYETMATGAKQAWIVNNSNPNPYEQLKFYDGEHFDYKALNGGPGWNGGSEVTALFDQITSEPDMNRATPYYKELRKIINQQVPSIPLYVPERLAFAVNGLDGLKLTLVGDIDFSKAYYK